MQVTIEETIVYPADEDYEVSHMTVHKSLSPQHTAVSWRTLQVPDVSQFDGLAFSGSSFSVNDDEPGIIKAPRLRHPPASPELFATAWQGCTNKSS